MYNFLVLGLVPGTNLQITFNTWLYALAAALGYAAFLYRRRFANAGIAVRTPLYANQLHIR